MKREAFDEQGFCNKGGLFMKKEISEKRVDFIVGNIAANLAFEGMVTPQQEIEELKEVVRGNISREEYKKRVLEECRVYAHTNR